MILICFGTRPEYIKIKPLLDEMQGVIPYQTLFTGQHEDLLEDVEFTHRLGIDDYERNRLDSIFASLIGSDIDFSQFDAVLVQGDTASACAMALTAFNNKCKVIHLEAGMRTYQMQHPWPEETYRQIIARVAEIHFAPSDAESGILKQEKVNGKVFSVGNTIGDTLTGREVSYEPKVIVTMHRRENHEKMDEWFETIEQLAKTNSDLDFILPIHPNPNVQKHRHILKSVRVIEPLAYSEMIDELTKCRFVITDSGGIQEECAFLKKHALVCRHRTERTALITRNVHVCPTPQDLVNEFYKLRDDYKKEFINPYGDGTTSKQIVEILKCEQL